MRHGTDGTVVALDITDQSRAHRPRSAAVAGGIAAGPPGHAPTGPDPAEGLAGGGVAGCGLAGGGLAGARLAGAGLADGGPAGGVAGCGLAGGVAGGGLAGTGLAGTGLAGTGLAGEGLAGTGLAGAGGGVAGAGLLGPSPGEAYAGWQPVRRAERQRGVDRLLPVDVAAMFAVALGTGGQPGMWLAAPAMLAVSYGVFGLYRSRLTLSVLDDLPRLAAGVAVAIGTGLTLSGSRGDLPAAYALRTFLAGAFAVVLIRAIGYPLARRSRRRRLGAPTLIVGGAQVGCQLGQILLAQPEYGLLPVGYLDSNPGGRRRTDLPAPLLGDHRDLSWLLAALEVRHVVVAFGAVRPAALVEVLRTCARMKCEILVVPRLFELHQRSREADHVRGIPLIRMRPAAPRRPTWRLKRLMDVAVAGPALVLAAPVLAVCALAVRLESGPGVLFRQERVGLDGRRFEILKLRSLRPASARESQVRWSVAGDRRLGPVGRVLRATSLDELPQLVNVLRGEMSLVGPRPERPYFVEQFGRQYPRYADRHRVPVGLTGWAAVNGLRGDTSIGDRIRYDNNYIEDWSLWLDIKIMVRTLGAILTRAGG